jgi:hypothetical protein
VGVQARLARCSQDVDNAIKDAVDGHARRLPPIPGPEADFAKKSIETARRAAQRDASIGGAWSGSDVDEAWINLHAAEVVLARYPSDAAAPASMLGALARSERALKPTDPRLPALRDAAKQTPTPETLALSADILQAGFAASDEDHRRLRDFRNILLEVSAALVLVMLLMGIIGSAAPNAIDLCWSSSSSSGTTTCPTGKGHATGGDVFAVELLGMIGAAVVGVPAVRRMRGTSTPYSVTLASLAVKVPLGALTAITGIAVTHLISSFTVSSALELQAYALVFGAAQQTVTAMLDRQAQNVLNSVPTAGDKSAAAS